MRIVVVAVGVALLFGFFRCSTAQPNPPASNSFTTGVYSYTGLNSAGKTVVTGKLELVEVRGKVLKGTWELANAGNGVKLGPQIGTGEFSGSVDDGGGIDLDLNPGTADNNVLLHGRMENGEFKGTWTYSTFVGPTTKGTFSAKKK